MGVGYFRSYRRRGMALATSLMLAVLMLVLGMSLLTTSQHDLAFQRQQRARDRADLLARSGLEHCLFMLAQVPPTLYSVLSPNTPQRFDVVPPTEYFTLERRDNGLGTVVLIAEGVITRTDGELVAKRTIVVPFGSDNNLTKQEIETQAFYP